MEAGPTELVTRLVYQLAIILFAAKLGGEIFERILKQPPVLGELLAGVAIGPFALGGLDLGGLGPLFLHAGSAGGRTAPRRRAGSGGGYREEGSAPRRAAGDCGRDRQFHHAPAPRRRRGRLSAPAGPPPG